MSWRRVALGATWLTAAGLAAAGEPVRAELQVFEPARPGFVPEAAPPRFVLLEGGRVIVGGTSALFAGELSRDELRDLEKRLEAAGRAVPAGPVRFGPGEQRFRLRLFEGRPVELNASGDPARAGAGQQLLARLLADLASFDHGSLRPFSATSYEGRALPQELPGGCRAWSLAVPLAELLAGPRTTPAEQLAGWPTGAVAASVCERGRRYAVTFRPLPLEGLR